MILLGWVLLEVKVEFCPKDLKKQEQILTILPHYLTIGPLIFLKERWSLPYKWRQCNEGYQADVISLMD